MTGALSEVFALAEQTIGVPLEFTRNLGGVFQDRLIAAFSHAGAGEGSGHHLPVSEQRGGS